jgi:hypothetical protein
VSNKIQEHNLTEIKKEIDRRNSEQYVHNLQEFGLSLGPESVVIVVQVHDRANYLKILLFIILCLYTYWTEINALNNGIQFL